MGWWYYFGLIFRKKEHTGWYKFSWKIDTPPNWGECIPFMLDENNTPTI
jgi:hypothetical protein